MSCEYCSSDSPFQEIFIEPLTHEWYLEVETSTWDEYGDDFVCERVYGINYCPYCGRKLEEESDN